MHALPVGPVPAKQHQLVVGTTLAAVAMAMLTGGMLAVWALQRTRAIDAGGTWLPSGVTIPEVPSNVMLISFAAVCVFAQWAVWSAKQRDRGHTGLALGALALVAVLIINAQAFVYYRMELPISAGTYAAMFYAITGMFMVLMIVGLAFTAVTTFHYLAGRTDGAIVVANAIYWYAVSVMYAAIWFVVYVTK